MKLLSSVIVSLFALLGCFSLQAASRASTTADMKQKLAALASSHSRLGGLLAKSGKGRFAFISKQNIYSKGEIQPYVEMFSGQLHFPIEFLELDRDVSVSTALECRKALNADVAVFLIADNNLPISLVAVEEKWAMINLSKIIEARCEKKVNDKRLQREFSRTFKALFSGVETKRGKTAVTKASDLDLITADPIDAQTLFNIINGAHSYGLIAPQLVPYRRACREGWAPKPTNDVQRAIWKEVHAMPSEPIRIKKKK